MGAGGHPEILRRFARQNVHYVLIGVSGINFYAEEAARGFFTEDCDILLEPRPMNIFKACGILEKEGYALEANREPLVGIDRWLANKLVERQAVIRAIKKDEIPLDLMTSGGGFSFKQWDHDKRIFKIGRIRVPVGNLLRLIRAKQKCNREKDRKFLALYKIQLKETLRELP